MSIGTREELEGMRPAGAVVAETLRRVGREVRAGVTTGELDEVAASCFGERGARAWTAA